MKECKDCNRWHKVYWDWKEWINSIYPTALKWLILSLIFIILIRSVYKELHADRETGC